MTPLATTRRQHMAQQSLLVAGGVWMLCALLLFFAGDARMAQYRLGQHHVRSAATQPFLDGTDGRAGLSFAALFLLWSMAALAVPAMPEVRRTLAAATARTTYRSSEFDPESHLRAPPRP